MSTANKGDGPPAPAGAEDSGEGRMYLPPTTPANAPKYRTIEMQRVRLAPEVDPRKAVTMPRIAPGAIGQGLAPTAIGQGLAPTAIGQGLAPGAIAPGIAPPRGIVIHEAGDENPQGRFTAPPNASQLAAPVMPFSAAGGAPRAATGPAPMATPFAPRVMGPEVAPRPAAPQAAPHVHVPQSMASGSSPWSGDEVAIRASALPSHSRPRERHAVVRPEPASRARLFIIGGLCFVAGLSIMYLLARPAPQPTTPIVVPSPASP